MGFQKTMKPTIVIASMFLAFTLTSCGKDKQEAPQPTAPAPTAQPMDATQPQAMPPGHPPMDGGQQGAMPAGHPPMQQQGAMPAGHPPAGGQQGAQMPPPQHGVVKGPKKAVEVSKEIKAKWSQVTLTVTDSTSGKSETKTVKVGGQTALSGAFTLKVAAFVPDYAITDNRITSRSNEPKNPAVLVELVEGGKVVAEGWVFELLPTFNSYKHARFTVALAPAK